MPLKVDLLNPSLDAQRRCHKKKRVVQSPNSYFMDVKCPGCYKIKVRPDLLRIGLFQLNIELELK